MLPAVSFGQNGRYFVAWSSFEQDGAGYGVYGRVAGANVRDLVFTSDATIVVPENTRGRILVTATDADQPGQPLRLSYSIIGGADHARFGMSADGTLSFLAAPDFENPTDSTADNYYLVQVQVTDGAGGVAMQTICVTVTNIAETNVEVSLPLFGGYLTVLKVEEKLHVVGPSLSDVMAPVRFNEVLSLVINGSSRNDIVRLDSSLAGFGGSFRFNGGSGADKLDASLIDFGVTMGGAAGNDTLLGGSGDDLFDGGANNDRAIGGAGNDQLTGGAGNDHLDGWLGDDTLIEFTRGNFTLTNSLLNGNGFDTLRNLEHAELTGSDGDNVLVASSFRVGGVTLHGGGGNDTLIGTSFDDTLDGGDGVDTVKQSAAASQTLTNSRLLGLGDDSLSAIEYAVLSITGSTGRVVDASEFSGSVTVNGGSGADTILGSAAGGTLNGNAGNDSISGGGSADVISCGAGNDVLFGAAGNDTLTGGDGNDILSGGDDADSLLGHRGRDLLIGGLGTDKLSGEAGDDLLIGDHWTLSGNVTALNAIMAEWSSTKSYAARVANVLNGGGANGTSRLSSDSIQNDFAIDHLIGGSERDWFFQTAGDFLVDFNIRNELNSAI